MRDAEVVAIEQQRAASSRSRPVGDLDQRALAGAVLADEPLDGLTMKIKGRAVKVPEPRDTASADRAPRAGVPRSSDRTPGFERGQDREDQYAPLNTLMVQDSRFSSTKPVATICKSHADKAAPTIEKQCAGNSADPRNAAANAGSRWGAPALGDEFPRIAS